MTEGERRSARRSRRVRWVALVSALVLGCPPSAWATPEAAEGARRHVEEAKRHYRLGRFADAAESYRAAYEAAPLPALLFNLGQCHRQLRQYDRAIFFYEGYLEGDADPESRRLTRELIRESKQRLAELRQVLELQRKGLLKPGSALAVNFGPLPERELTASGPEAPLHEQWWFWTVVGGAALVTVGGTLLALSSGGGRSGAPGTLR